MDFIKNNKPKTIVEQNKVDRTRPNDFSFIEDMTSLLRLTKTTPLSLRLDNKERWIPEKIMIPPIAKECKGFDLKSEEGQDFFYDYISRIITKLVFSKTCTHRK